MPYQLHRYEKNPILSPLPGSTWESEVTTNPAAWLDEKTGDVLLLYRAAGDVVGMLVPKDELATLHTPARLADHVTASTLAALGVCPPLGASPAHAVPPATKRSPRGSRQSRSGKESTP